MSILQSFIAGQEARRQADAAAEINRMQQFLAQNGQAIFQGDPNALGALAGMGAQGLETAMGLRNSQEERAARQAAQERQGVLQQREDEAWKWKVEEYAASKTAAERAAEAQEIEEGTKMALMAETPEQFDQIVTQAGMPEYVGMFDQREMLAARFMTVADILKQNTAPDPTNGAPTGYKWADPANPGAGVVPLPGYEKSSGVTINTGDMGGATAQIGTIPQGYVAVPDPQSPAGYTMMPIPGGPEDMSEKDARKTEQGQLKLGTTLESLNLNIAEIENGGLPVTGAMGDFRRTDIGRALTGNNAVDFGNRTAQVTDSAALAEVQNMRDNSPTGGAVGSLTDDERRAIGNAVTGINNSTSAEEYLRAAKAFRKLALDLAYGQGTWELDADGQVKLKDGSVSGSGSPETPPAPAGSTPSPQPAAPLPPDLQSIYDKYSTP